MAPGRRAKVLAQHVVAGFAAAEGAPLAKSLEAAEAAAQAAQEEARQGCKGYEEILERNWHGSVRFNGTPVVPESLEALQRAVREGDAPIRVVGRGHSFTALAECAGGTLLSLAKLNKVLDFRAPTESKLGSITVQGGTTYTEIAAFMGRRGALRNLPSCPQFTVAGAIATGTHGSGVEIQNLASQVSAIEFVTADGSLVAYSRAETPVLLEGCRVHLGALGVVSQLTLDVVPFYEVETCLYQEADLARAAAALPRLWSCCDSLSLYTRGFGREGPDSGKAMAMMRHFRAPGSAEPVQRRPDALSDATIAGEMPRYYADDESVIWKPTGRKAWVDGLTLTCDGGQETDVVMRDLQAEFFVPLASSQEAVRAVWAAARDWTFGDCVDEQGNSYQGLVFMFEFRETKGDGAWLSPQPMDSLCIHISFCGAMDRVPEVQKAVANLEKALWHLQPRAHWGKLAARCFAPRVLQDLYGEGLEKFRELRRRHDPKGKFLNAHLRHLLS